MTLETLKFWLDTEGGALNENNQLRPYQLESRNRILYSWLNGARSVMYQSPTGSGKTVTIASIVKLCADTGFKTLTLAHREELVDNINGMSTAAIVQIQLQYFIKNLDEAIAMRLKKLIVIHGIGTGRLKAEVYNALENYPKLKYQDASYAKYGFGATEILIY